MKKWLAVFLMLAVGLLMAGCGKGGGHWVLVDTEFHEEEWQAALAAENQRDGFYQSEAQVSAGSFIWTRTYIDEDKSDKQPFAFPGNSATVQGSWTKPSDTVQGPEFEVSMRIKIEVVDQDPAHPVQHGCYIDAQVPIPDDDGVIYGYLCDDDGESTFYPSPENGFAPVAVIVYGDMEKGQTAGEHRALEVRVGPGHPLMSYIYEWREQ